MEKRRSGKVREAKESWYTGTAPSRNIVPRSDISQRSDKFHRAYRVQSQVNIEVCI